MRLPRHRGAVLLVYPFILIGYTLSVFAVVPSAGSPQTFPIVLWLEAEQAQKTNFNDIYPALGLSGGKGIHFSTATASVVEQFSAEYRFSVETAGQYALWSRRHLLYIDQPGPPLISYLHRYIEMSWRVDGGEWHRPVSEPTPINVEGRYPSSVGHLGFTKTGDTETAGKYIGWYLDNVVLLTSGAHTFQVRFHARQTSVTPLLKPRGHRYYGLLDAFVFATPGYVPKGRIPPEFARFTSEARESTPASVTVSVDASAVQDTLPRLFGIHAVGPDTSMDWRYRALKPGLVRITHLYNAAKVMKDASNRITIDWTQLDAQVDHAFSLGGQPLLCLGYTPAVLSSLPADVPRGHVAGDPGMYPPSDYRLWEEVVYLTVRHFNVERKLNIRYWEVWNEPNNVFLQVWPIWPWMDTLPLIGTFLEYAKKLYIYCQIYEYAARGAIRADPSILIGGPTALADGEVYDPYGSVSWWVPVLSLWSRIKGVRLDLVTLHLYAGSPDSVSPQHYGKLINEARQWGAIPGNPPPEVIIDEWNAWSMEGGHDTITEYHGIWVAECLYEMLQSGALHSVYYGNGASWLGLFRGESPTPTPAYNVLRMTALLEPVRVHTSTGITGPRVLATRSKDRVTILAWRFGTSPVDLKWSIVNMGFKPGTSIRVHHYLVDQSHSNLRWPSGNSELEQTQNYVLGGAPSSVEINTRLAPNSATLLVLEPDISPGKSDGPGVD